MTQPRRSPAFSLAALMLAIASVTPSIAMAGPPARPTTLAQALAEAYANNPTLQQQRANLRATDENVPAALAGWRPTITVQGTVGRITGTSSEALPSTNPFTGVTSLNHIRLPQSRNEVIGQITVTQPIYTGGATIAKTHEAKNNVYSARAQLYATEQTVFTSVVQAYVTVITDRQLLALDLNNLAVLRQQLHAVRDQFNVGELTETSVAQAEASVAQAHSTVEIARGDLHIANENFRRYVGAYPAKNLVSPQPLALPVASKTEAAKQAARNNPNVVVAIFAQAAAKDAVDVAIAALAPQLSVSASAFDENNPSGPHTASTGGQVLANLTVPLYQGGTEYAAIRQARDKVQAAFAALIDAQRTAVAQATQSWEALRASQAAVRSSQSQIRADAIALDGTERQEIVGTRTTLDVLNAQQALLNAQTQQIQNIGNVVTSSYGILAAIGRLTATDLGLPVHHYNDLKYYRAVKEALFGNGNLAYHDVGIAPNGDLLSNPVPTNPASVPPVSMPPASAPRS
ncbi:MAG TPA: TolC family outer membrane protein [Acidiphilium sp.]|nr:TolC family outer membrane protein [Acidiphilium sp.]HQU24727.1 TolC family outer membrane protein [Acidiphilium sp.]